jgi:hypothetical protein
VDFGAGFVSLAALYGVAVTLGDAAYTALHRYPLALYPAAVVLVILLAGAVAWVVRWLVEGKSS